MKKYLLPSNNVEQLITQLSKKGLVFYPACEDGTVHFTKYEKDKKFEPDFEKIRTAENIKHFFFPSRESVAKFPKDEKAELEECYLFGVKNCDLKGLDVYDRVFLNWQPTDPFFKARRKKTIVISADCPEPEDCCFCSLVGIGPYADGLSDLNFTKVSSGLLFEIFNTRGEKLINDSIDLFTQVTSDREEEQSKIRRNAIKKLGKINDKPFKEDLPGLVENADDNAIRAARDECVECHACLHVCPTTYCFLLSDYKKGKNIERVRTWDACYYAAYARVGGGANPRSHLDRRFWNRFQCKFNYFYKYENIYACSGCGRCYRGCSAKIDIREILWKL